MMDWLKFVNQAGPYIMGENAKRVADHDRRIRASAWREYSADWIKNGERAHELVKLIKENKTSEVNMCIAGTFDGGIYLPQAIIAEMYYCADGDYLSIVRHAARRTGVSF